MPEYTTKELDDLSVSLRNEEVRLNFPKEKIEDVISQLKNKLDERDYKFCSLLMKILVNYVADVVENAKFVYELIKDILPVAIGVETDDDKKFFMQVQLILINNMLTTNKEMFEKDHCLVIFEALLKIDSETVDDSLIVEILQDIHSIISQVEIRKFLEMKKILKEIRSTGDDEVCEMVDSVLLQYSTSLTCESLDNTEKLTIFKELFCQLKSMNDEQVLLNVVFEMNIDSEEFYKELIDIIFDPKTTRIKHQEHLPALLLLLSNQIRNENDMKRFVESVSINNLIEYYFHTVYPNLTLKHPWELQSIALLNKIPLTCIKSIQRTTLENYLNALSKLITTTTLQINVNLVILQMTFLGKILGSIEDTRNKELINGFLTDIKLSNEYESFPHEFKIILNQVYFQYLYTHKDSEDDEVKTVLQNTLEESERLLKGSIEGRMPLQMIYLVELSKIFGFYVSKYRTEEWFKKSFDTMISVFNDANEQMQKNGNPTWKILENNIQYTKYYEK